MRGHLFSLGSRHAKAEIYDRTAALFSQWSEVFRWLNQQLPILLAAMGFCFRGARRDDGYCEVVQYDQGIRFHLAGQRRQRRLSTSQRWKQVQPAPTVEHEGRPSFWQAITTMFK
jgi:hypothetical protein